MVPSFPILLVPTEDELVSCILSFLSTFEQYKFCKGVCRQWRRICQNLQEDEWDQTVHRFHSIRDKRKQQREVLFTKEGSDGVERIDQELVDAIKYYFRMNRYKNLIPAANIVDSKIIPLLKQGALFLSTNEVVPVVDWLPTCHDMIFQNSSMRQKESEWKGQQQQQQQRALLLRLLVELAYSGMIEWGETDLYPFDAYWYPGYKYLYLPELLFRCVFLGKGRHPNNYEVGPDIRWETWKVFRLYILVADENTSIRHQNEQQEDQATRIRTRYYLGDEDLPRQYHTFARLCGICFRPSEWKQGTLQPSSIVHFFWNQLLLFFTDLRGGKQGREGRNYLAIHFCRDVQVYYVSPQRNNHQHFLIWASTPGMFSKEDYSVENDSFEWEDVLPNFWATKQWQKILYNKVLEDRPLRLCFIHERTVLSHLCRRKDRKLFQLLVFCEGYEMMECGGIDRALDILLQTRGKTERLIRYFEELIKQRDQRRQLLGELLWCCCCFPTNVILHADHFRYKNELSKVPLTPERS